MGIDQGRIVDSDAAKKTKFLKSGAEFKKSLQDGRVIFYQGEQIDDVTAFRDGGGIDQIAELYDEQFTEPGQSKLTYTREDDQLVTTSYMVPHTREDLVRRRDGIKYVARKTWGTHCRGIDMISCLPVGMLGFLPTFRKHCPELAENIVNYRKYAEENNLYLSETIVDPQGFRGRSGGTTPDTPPPDRAVARITREDKKGSGSAASRASERWRLSATKSSLAVSIRRLRTSRSGLTSRRMRPACECSAAKSCIVPTARPTTIR